MRLITRGLGSHRLITRGYGSSGNSVTTTCYVVAIANKAVATIYSEGLVSYSVSSVGSSIEITSVELVSGSINSVRAVSPITVLAERCICR